MRDSRVGVADMQHQKLDAPILNKLWEIMHGKH